MSWAKTCLTSQSAGAAEYTASLQRAKTPCNECPGYDTEQFDGEASVMQEFGGMQSTPSLLSLPGPLWPGVVAPDRVLSMSQIEQKCNYAKLNCLQKSCLDIYFAYLC